MRLILLLLVLMAVFGVYRGQPRAGRCNGYVSLWVGSVASTYDYLKSQGVSFPVVESINSRRGIDSQPGYKQLYTTDSEGNGLLFTEYP